MTSRFAFSLAALSALPLAFACNGQDFAPRSMSALCDQQQVSTRDCTNKPGPTEPDAEASQLQEAGVQDGGRLDSGDGGGLDDGGLDDGNEAGLPLADPLFVKVGVPGEETGLEFVELPDGGDIRVQRGGQGGSHALLAIQCKGLGRRVFFSAAVRNLDGDGEVSTAELPRSRPIACDDDGLCKIVPVFVQLGGLAPRESWDGLYVEASATVRNPDGLERTGSVRGYLRPIE